MRLTLGFSTCPNDTFIFDALVNGRLDTGGIEFDVVLADILHLNQMALAGQLDMVKVSFHTYGSVRDRYALLDAGGAVGHRCGPLLISRTPTTLDALTAAQARVLVPGFNTTANLLLSRLVPALDRKEERIFHEIMPALVAGEADAGVIIHENRFTYPGYGLHLVCDLGELWETRTGLPIPLGAIVARKSLGPELIRTLESLLRSSVQYAFDHPEASRPFVRQHAQEMDEDVMQAHIQLYVNEYSLSLGEQGRKAVEALLGPLQAAASQDTR